MRQVVWRSACIRTLPNSVPIQVQGIPLLPLPLSDTIPWLWPHPLLVRLVHLKRQFRGVHHLCISRLRCFFVPFHGFGLILC